MAHQAAVVYVCGGQPSQAVTRRERKSIEIGIFNVTKRDDLERTRNELNPVLSDIKYTVTCCMRIQKKG